MAWRFPLRLGAPDTTHEVEHRALLDYLRQAFDVDSSTELWAETWVDAWAIAMIWRINRRIANQNFPLRMMENLPKWEEACTLRPAFGDLDVERRRRLAAKLRGLSGNTIDDLEAAASQAMGVNFDALILVDPDDEIAYWPGLNPGPPGYEWSSNRATIGIRVQQGSLTHAEYIKKIGYLIDTMINLVPAWQTFVIGEGSQFIVDVGIVGQTVLSI